MSIPDIRKINEDASPNGNKLIRSIVANLFFASFMIFFTILIGGVILANYLQSAKHQLMTRIIFFSDGFGALAIFAFLLTNFIDLDGLWLSFFLGKSAGLALEEMIAIIAEKGFGDDRKHNIDIKLVITDGQIDIRLRDNFMYFDTAKRVEIMNSEDGISNIGIKILNSISHDTEYYSTLNVNYLVMHIAPQTGI